MGDKWGYIVGAAIIVFALGMIVGGMIDTWPG
jgi:hypothetical protein